jgi:primosomal protein N' (replication factor Y)
VGLARFLATAPVEADAQAAAERVALWLRRASDEHLGGALTVLGPAPCPITRLQGRWRWHLLVKAADPRALGRVMRAWRTLRRGVASVTVDRDPVSLL